MAALDPPNGKWTVRLEGFTAVTMNNAVFWDVIAVKLLYEPTFRRNVALPSSG
jgi:hypothetical protein